MLSLKKPITVAHYRVRAKGMDRSCNLSRARAACDSQKYWFNGYRWCCWKCQPPVSEAVITAEMRKPSYEPAI